MSLSVSGLEVGCLHLAALVLLDIVGYALVLAQRAHSRTFNVGDVDKRVGSATLGLDEAEAFGLVKKLDCTCGDLTVPSRGRSERRYLRTREAAMRTRPTPVRIAPRVTHGR